MAKSNGTGRGGARPGAGRKPDRSSTRKARLDAYVEQRVSEAVVSAVSMTDADFVSKVRALAGKALETYADLMDHGSDAARRAAAADVLKWACVAPDVAARKAAGDEGAGDDAALGKKDARAARAKRASQSGKFAVPAGPRLAVSND